MKKIFAVILVIALTLTAITAFGAGENIIKNSTWVKIFGQTDVTTSTEGGSTVYSFGGVEQSYYTAGVDILPALKNAIKGNSSITVRFELELKATYKAGNDADEDFALGVLLRPSGLSSEVSSEDGFKSYYAGSLFHLTSGNIVCRLSDETENFIINAEEWTAFEAEVEITAHDINCGYWSGLNLCFDRMAQCEMLDKLHVKNAGLYVIDSTKGDDSGVATNKPKPTQTASGGNTGATVTPSPDDPNAADTPTLPENNLLKNTAWANGVGTVNVSTSEFNGNTVYTVTGINKEYISPGFDIFSTLQQYETDEPDEELAFWIVFDARAKFINSSTKEFPFGVKIRAYGLTENTNTSESFAQNYTETGTFMYSSGNVYNTLIGDTVMTSEWQRYEFFFCPYSYDIDEQFWNQWIVCFDRMKQFNTVSAIQVKNAGIFFEDDYEPINVKVEDDDDNGGSSGVSGNVTPTPVTIYKPHGFNKYPITFTDALDPNQTPSPVPTKVASATSTATNGEDAEVTAAPVEKGLDTSIVIAIVAAVVIIGGGVTVAIIILKKQSKKTDSEVNE